MNSNHIEKEDIQGIITKGYSELPACTFLLLAIKDKSAARLWLKNITPAVTQSDIKHPQSALNIAFTFEGLKALGLPAESLDSFPLELEDGMTTTHKQLFLGDYGESAPAFWDWGGNQNETIHILLMLYAATDSELQTQSASHRNKFDPSGLKEIKELPTAVLSKRKEHFGFHDGISQPTIAGLNRKDAPENTVATGEFILGYKNSYGQYPASPMVPQNSGDSQQLEITDKQGMRDLGRNGSYLVFRQMEQDVELFWNYMDEATAHEGVCQVPEMIKLAAKIVGRWPSGAPVTVCPDEDMHDMEDKNNFDYRTSDAKGLKCPVGSHIRRTNPRDMLDTDKMTSIEVSNKHRLLRRGRSYGKPVCESLDPQDILQQKNIEGKRGLYFICVNADIGRQFEFVQNAWVNNPKFLSLYDERDPVIGNNMHPQYPETTGVFSMPTKSIRDRYTNLPRFATVKGGAYFFLPGIKALRYLSTL